MTTLRQTARSASTRLDPLWAALVGLCAGVSLGGHLGSLTWLLALLRGG